MTYTLNMWCHFWDFSYKLSCFVTACCCIVFTKGTTSTSVSSFSVGRLISKTGRNKDFLEEVPERNSCHDFWRLLLRQDALVGFWELSEMCAVVSCLFFCNSAWSMFGFFLYLVCCCWLYRSSILTAHVLASTIVSSAFAAESAYSKAEDFITDSVTSCDYVIRFVLLTSLSNFLIEWGSDSYFMNS